MSTQQTPIIDLVAYDSNTDPTSGLWLAIQHNSWSVPKKVEFINQLIALATSQEFVQGSELLPSTNWTSTGWTGTFATGFIHTPGNTTALSNTLAAIADNVYLVSFVVSARTAGSFSVAFGGNTSTLNEATNAYRLKASTNNNLIITPTTDFDGKIIISISQTLWELTGADILTLLGKDALYSQSQVDSGFVAKVTGKSLILDTEISRLATVPTPYTINLPAAANLAAKIAAAVEGTDYPTGWVLTATDTVNLTITHNLAKEIDHVTVKKVVGAVKTILDPKSTAYSQVKATTTSILVIEGIDPTATQTLIHLTFMP